MDGNQDRSRNRDASQGHKKSNSRAWSPITKATPISDQDDDINVKT